MLILRGRVVKRREGLVMEHPEICASFDMDKETAIATRKRILKYASDNALTMAGMHFPAPAFITE